MSVPRAVQDLVWKRARGCCERCGRGLRRGAGGYSLHHRRLRSAGGLDSAANLVLLCGSGTTRCHGWAHAHPEIAMAGGWIVSRLAEPAAVPVPLAWLGLCRLLEDGSVERLEEEPPEEEPVSLEQLGW